jgi:hypothetical protein
MDMDRWLKMVEKERQEVALSKRYASASDHCKLIK